MTGGLLDTSVVIAQDEGGKLDIPNSAAVSIITIGKLRAGVVLADERTRDARERRLQRVSAAFLAIPVDSDVAFAYGELLAFARREHRIEKATDLLILATAVAAGRALYTRDHRQAALGHAAGASVVEFGRV